MNDVKFGDLVARMAISLAVVLALMFIAYRIIKRRQSGPPAGGRRGLASGLASGLVGGLTRAGRAAGTPRARRGPSARPVNAKRGLKVVARAGLSKTSSVIAVQFGESVFLVGASDQAAPAVLAEIGLPAWTASIEESDDASTVVRVPVTVGGTSVAAAGKPSVIDALREMTARRG